MLVVNDPVFGDSGKGRVIDIVSRMCGANLNFRYTGGPQAIHHVVTDDGIVHPFAQSCSGSFVKGVRSYLTRFMLIEPFALFNEYEALVKKGLTDIWDRTFIEDEALVVTPFHIMANRIRELARGNAAHGSCGMGVWETRAFALAYPNSAIVAADFSNQSALTEKLVFAYLQEWNAVKDLVPLISDNDALTPCLRVFEVSRQVIENTVETFMELADKVQIVGKGWFSDEVSNGFSVGEGAQGVLLSDLRGFHPHTSATDTTTKNANTLIAEANFKGDVKKLGVIRAYMTRHGAGPFVTEDQKLTALLPEWHNERGRWQGSMRVGYQDLIMLRYAFSISDCPDGLAVTCLDRMKEISQWKIAYAYDYKGNPSDLDGQCVHDGRRIFDIVPFWSEDEQTQLFHQEALGRILFHSKPVYKVVSSHEDTYLSFLEEHLEVPVVLTSNGVTSRDFKVRKAEFF